MRWLREPSPAAVADALRMAAPDLAGLPVTIPSLAGQDDPVWQMSTAALGEDYIVKFAWSRAAARFVLHQIRILEMLAVEPAVPYLPEVVAAGTSPLILVTRRVRGTSLFKVVDGIGDTGRYGLRRLVLCTACAAALQGQDYKREVPEARHAPSASTQPDERAASQNSAPNPRDAVRYTGSPPPTVSPGAPPRRPPSGRPPTPYARPATR